MPTTTEEPVPIAAREPGSGRDIEIVIPVYNEEVDLEPNIVRLHTYLRTCMPFSYRITIADNASTDSTWLVARSLADRLPDVRAVHLDLKGRGRALHAVWSASDARVVTYMDVDLSTDLSALLPLVAPLLSGHSDIAIGSRLAQTSRVVRGSKREVISRSYNLLLRAVLRARFSDAQCGFKAMRTEAARLILPLVEDSGWFFDTELLVLAERCGMRIHEVPVDWIDDPDSRVDILATALADLRGVARLARGLASGRLPVSTLREQLGRAPLAPPPGVPAGLVAQLARFAGIGVVSTGAYLLLFLLFRQYTGPHVANITALLVTAIANTAANRRLTFGVRGAGAATAQLEGLVVFGLGVVLTTGSLAVLDATSRHPGKGTELAVLVVANLAATVIRFLLFRAWVFHPRRQHRRGAAAGAGGAPTAATGRTVTNPAPTGVAYSAPAQRTETLQRDAGAFRPDAAAPTDEEPAP
jgi:putative flippase GtrA